MELPIEDQRELLLIWMHMKGGAFSRGFCDDTGLHEFPHDRLYNHGGIHVGIVFFHLGNVVDWHLDTLRQLFEILRARLWCSMRLRIAAKAPSDSR